MWKHVSENFGDGFFINGIDVRVRCHAEDTGRHSARTEAFYDEWIPSNDVFENYTRAFGDGPRNFEPWSSDEDDT
ncbi:hypothetical protein TNCV_620431 [Trichonephila clavipes]|nr:hypothetical protein TNCV_620431 [Trichonephila clavipes]